MRVVLFVHSLLSDWHNDGAHFLRGVVTELAARGHRVVCYEPRNSRSVEGLMKAAGPHPIEAVLRLYPALDIIRYMPTTLDVDVALKDADLVLVHQWNEPELIKRVGEKRKTSHFMRAYFHDTHHRALTNPASMSDFDLSEYDGVLATGEALRVAHEKHGWAKAAWTWHEAADVRIFKPLLSRTTTGEMMKRDLVYVGNWANDANRDAAIHELVIEPIKQLGLDADVCGAGYPAKLADELLAADIRYRGWVPGYALPESYAQHYATVYVPPSQPIPGVPKGRLFEALACGIPVISGPWDDTEGLFTPGKDYLVAEDTRAMMRHLRDLLSDTDMAAALATRGRATVQERHTCAHRVDELLAIHESLQG
ncbi:MAG: glycosyltransferase [Myxococcota bacterium]